MSKKVVRTFNKSYCSGVRMGEAGRIVPFTDTLCYPVSAAQATRKFRRMYRDPSIIIESVEVVSEKRAMSLDMFYQYSHEDNE